MNKQDKHTKKDGLKHMFYICIEPSSKMILDFFNGSYSDTPVFPVSEDGEDSMME